MPAGRAGQAVRQLRGEAVHLCVDAGALQHLQAGDAGRDGGRVAGHRPGLIGRTERRHLLHDLLAAAVRADRQAAADDFAERGQVRPDRLVVLKPGVRLRRAVMEAEGRNDLVVNDEGAVLPR